MSSRKRKQPKEEDDAKPPCFACGKAASVRGKHFGSCWAYLVPDGEEALEEKVAENAAALDEAVKGEEKGGVKVYDTKLMGTLQTIRPLLVAALEHVKEQKATLMRAPSIKQLKVPYDHQWSASTGLLTITWNGIATVLDGDVITQTRVGDGGSSL